MFFGFKDRINSTRNAERRFHPPQANRRSSCGVASFAVIHLLACFRCASWAHPFAGLFKVDGPGTGTTPDSTVGANTSQHTANLRPLSRVTSHWARERGRRIGTGAAEQGAWSGEDGRTYQTWGSSCDPSWYVVWHPSKKARLKGKGASRGHGTGAAYIHRPRMNTDCGSAITLCVTQCENAFPTAWSYDTKRYSSSGAARVCAHPASCYRLGAELN